VRKRKKEVKTVREMVKEKRLGVNTFFTVAALYSVICIVFITATITTHPTPLYPHFISFFKFPHFSIFLTISIVVYVKYYLIAFYVHVPSFFISNPNLYRSIFSVYNYPVITAGLIGKRKNNFLLGLCLRSPCHYAHLMLV